MGFVLAVRVSLHREAGGSGGAAVDVVPHFEGWTEVDCQVEGGRRSGARSSDRLAAVSEGGIA